MLRRKLALAAASAVVSAALLEVAFRAVQRSRFARTVEAYESELYAPELGTPWVYALRPAVARDQTIEGAEHVEWSYTIDADGFRVAGRGKDEGPVRVLAIGDSYTFGWGVGDDEAWPARLERAIDGLLPEARVDVVNGGVPGHNTSQVAALARHRIDTVDPRVIVLGMVMNDAEPTRVLPQDPDRRYALAWSWIWEDVVVRLGLADGPFRSRLQRHRGYVDQFADGAPERLLCERAFDDVVALARERGVPLLVAVFPDTTRAAEAEYPYGSIHAEIAGWCADRGVACVDLRASIEGLDGADVCVPVDGHPSALAHERFADAIARAIPAVIE